MENKTSIAKYEDKFNSIVQILFLLADTQFLFGELGRGSGKSTEILGSRFCRVAYGMPGCTFGVAGPTYVSLMQNILPAITKYLSNNYKKGIHYEIGTKPPRHFKDPVVPVYEWNHTISFANGSVAQMVSVDRPESALSKSLAHIVVDELLRIDEEKFAGRILATLRGDREIHGFSHYFGGISGFSSAPLNDNDEDWWTGFEKQMDRKVIDEIMDVALEIHHNKHEFKTSKFKNNRDKAERFINRWLPRVNEKRVNQTYYGKASSFSNILILGLDYITNQFKSTKDFELFKANILNIRRERVKNMFFAKFGKQHIFKDSYIYDKDGFGAYKIDSLTLNESMDTNSLMLKYCDSTKPLYGGFDPGSFMSLVIGQRNIQKKEFRLIKNFFCWTPRQHSYMAEMFNNFFKFHLKKELILHYDRAGNKEKKSKSGDINDTDAILLKNELEKLGWKVTLMSLGKRVIFYWEHFNLLNILFDVPVFGNDKIFICENECEELISSIFHSPLKKTTGKVELDKSSEVELDYDDQALYSTQISSALTYLLFGEYEKYLPTTKREIKDYAI